MAPQIESRSNAQSNRSEGVDGSPQPDTITVVDNVAEDWMPRPLLKESADSEESKNMLRDFTAGEPARIRNLPPKG